jgi:hypothetical protein
MRGVPVKIGGVPSPTRVRKHPNVLTVVFAVGVVAASEGVFVAAAQGPLHVDLRRIGHVAPAGRVQDKDLNPHLTVVDQLVAAGPGAIPFLVSKLEDGTPVPGHVFDYWVDVRVGDIALVILVDFFMKRDFKTMTVPTLDWYVLLERGDPNKPDAELLANYVARHGRRELRQKVERLLEPYAGRFVWDPTELCFKPTLP